MTTVLQKAENLLSRMSRGEKAQLLQWVVRDISGDSFPGIEKTVGIVGGNARIIRTRIPVWSIILFKKLGASDADILNNYPSLNAEDLINAAIYYRNNKEEIDTAIAENEAD